MPDGTYPILIEHRYQIENLYNWIIKMEPTFRQATDDTELRLEPAHLGEFHLKSGPLPAAARIAIVNAIWRRMSFTLRALWLAAGVTNRIADVQDALIQLGRVPGILPQKANELMSQLAAARGSVIALVTESPQLCEEAQKLTANMWD